MFPTSFKFPRRKRCGKHDVSPVFYKRETSGPHVVKLYPSPSPSDENCCVPFTPRSDEVCHDVGDAFIPHSIIVFPLRIAAGSSFKAAYAHLRNRITITAGSACRSGTHHPAKLVKDRRFSPWFKDVIGAIDGPHPGWVPTLDHSRCRT